MHQRNSQEQSSDLALTGSDTISRRSVVKGAAALGGLSAIGMLGSGFASAQAAKVLPVNTNGLDHFDIVATDVHEAAKFYMGVFNTVLHAQPFRGTLRYFVLLGELNEAREVGYLAIGDLRGRVPNIGHFCTSIVEWRRDSAAILSGLGEAFVAGGFGAYPESEGVGSLFADPDGIEIQFLPSPDTLVTQALPNDLVPWNKGLVTPHGLDHMVLRVSNLDRAIRYYEIIYGPVTNRDTSAGRATFRFANGTYLVLEQARYEYGQTPKIASACVKVDAFDRGKLEAGLRALGAQLVASNDEPELLGFRDPDGLTIVLRPV